MSSLQIHVTAAGRAALVNAPNTGTVSTRVSRVGVSASGTGLSGGALAGEIKRLSTFAGMAVADDTIHVTIRDDSEDAYALRAFALYLDDGTLFAWYAQAGVILEKSAQAMLLLATDVRFVQVDATSLTFGSTDWLNPPATTMVQGVVELADNAESIAGADAVRAMTPAGTKAMLDDRFGAGAPSGLAKGLLSLATAALMRAAIGLGNAATRNEGAGQGLDADLLDGQHGAYYRDWNNLQNRPAAYPPSGHLHAWAEIDGVPSTATRWPTFAEVTEKPVAYPPSQHVHAAAEVTSGVFDGARIPSLPISKIDQLAAALASKTAKAPGYWPGNDANTLTEFGGHQFTSGSLNTPHGDWATVLSVGQGDRSFQLANSWNYGAEFYLRQQNAGNWSRPLRIWHDGNFDPGSKANVGHGHAIGEVSGLQGALDAKFDKAGGTLSGDVAIRKGVPIFNMVSADGTRGYRLVSNVGDGVNYGFAIDVFNGSTWAAGLALSPGGALAASGGYDFGSSRKLKTIEGPVPYGLAEVEAMELAAGRYRPEYNDDGRKRLFFVAEQLAGLVPEAVDMEGVEFNGERVPAIKLDQILPVMARAIQELAAEVRALKAER
ncbi:MAG TPA: tail fiber domain-containing protein [Lysobacter sp.]